MSRLWIGIILVAGACGAAVGVYHLLRRGLPQVAERTDRANSSELVWLFEQPERGAILSTPLVTEDRIYVGAVQDRGLRSSGAVWCLARATGRKVWRFDDDGGMLHMISSPCLADGRLYIGEGMHANFVCKLYCLDAATGKKLWRHEAAGHIESSPCVSGGRVYFGAGDDGIHCLDSLTGKPCWHFQESVHVDSNPAVHDNRLYAGSGGSRRLPATEALCLNAETGSPLWRTATELPAWGSPAVAGEDVYFGLGNGRMLQSADQPAGALLRVHAATGQLRGTYAVGDAVFAAPVVHRDRVYFAARDGHCYCVDRNLGRLYWKEYLGSPIVARPALHQGRLYVVATGGLVYCLDAETGRARWSFDVARHSGTQPQIVSSPVVAVEADGSRRIYFGSELKGAVSSAAVLYCLSDP
jgi:outer membrane protein assembly factor BamB